MHKPECFSFKIWELFLLFFFPAALHLGYSISCLCPCLIFQLTRLSSSSHDSELRYSECSKATQMHWFRTFHRPNLSSRNLPFFLLCWQIMWGCCSQEPDFEIVYLCVCMCVWRFVCVWGVYWGICEAQISICVQWLSCETELPLCRVDKTWCPVFLFSTLHCGSCWFHWTLCCTYNNVAETIFWFRQWTQNNIFQNHLSSFFSSNYLIFTFDSI